MEENDKSPNLNSALEVEEEKNQPDKAVLEEMANAGILSGRKSSKTNPRMKKYIYATRNSFEVIDLVQTTDLLEKASSFLKEVAKKGQLILLIGTRAPAQNSIELFAKKFNFPYVTERWLGGTLTNFDEISKRLNYYLALKSDQAGGRLEKYTKKERVAIDKKIEKMDKLFGGLEKLANLPSAVIIVNAESHQTAIREANRMKIPTVVIANTSANPDNIDYIIPANDNNKESINYLLVKLEESIAAGLKEKNSPVN